MLTWCRLRAARWTSRHITLISTQNFNTDVPRITVPQKMVERLRRHNIKKTIESAKRERLGSKTLILSAKRVEYNHYKGEEFKTFDPKKLASHGWKHRNCGRDFFTLVPHDKNPALSAKDELKQGFEGFQLDPRLLRYLANEDIEWATEAQKLLIPEMLSGKHIVCAAETGSGKTYGYLLPLMHDLLSAGEGQGARQDPPGEGTEVEMEGREPCELGQEDVDVADNTEQSAGDGQTSVNRNSPRAIVMVPSKELADQVMSVCQRLSQSIPLNTFMLCGGRKMQTQLRSAQGVEMDILIATPGILKRMITSGHISIKQLTSVVMDEADTLLDDSFTPLTLDILRKLQIGRQETSVADSVQLVLVSATYPRGLDTTIGQVLPAEDFTKLTTRHLHHVMPHVPQKFIKMKSLDKTENILKVLKQKKMVTMIFCNTSKTCYWLSQTLQELRIDNLCLTGFLQAKERAKMFQSFLDGDHDVLVCTDIASRGLDTQLVEHVINFDFPKYMSDYVHRAGRVGRVGAKHSGQVTSFVVHPWDVDLVWKIEIAVRQRSELYNVNANIKRKINNVVEQKYGLNI